MPADDDVAPVVLAEPQGPGDAEDTGEAEGSADEGSADEGSAGVEGPTDGEGPAGTEGSAEVQCPAETDGSVEAGGDGVESPSPGLGEAEEPVPAEPPVDAVAAEPAEASAADPDATGAARPWRPRVSLRRGAAAAAGVLVVALAVSAFSTVAPSSADADRHFVDTARSQGRVVTGGDQQALLISAARKICDRRASHTTAAERRATALSSDELTAIQQTFAGDTRGFTALALDTYCSS